jgi:hypothetical protein
VRFVEFLKIQTITKCTVLVTETDFEVFRSRAIFCHSDSKQNYQLAVQHRQQPHKNAHNMRCDGHHLHIMLSFHRFRNEERKQEKTSDYGNRHKCRTGLQMGPNAVQEQLPVYCVTEGLAPAARQVQTFSCRSAGVPVAH